MMDHAKAFTTIVDAYSSDPEVTRGRMFGADGLKVNGKVFAMVVKGRLVVKLPKERVAHLVSEGACEAFDPGHGKPMKEWVSVPPASLAEWSGLVDEARSFVRRGR